MLRLGAWGSGSGLGARVGVRGWVAPRCSTLRAEIPDAYPPQVRSYPPTPGASTCWARRTRACPPPWCARAHTVSPSSARARRAISPYISLYLPYISLYLPRVLARGALQHASCTSARRTLTLTKTLSLILTITLSLTLARRASTSPWRAALSCTTGCASAPSTREGWVGRSAGRAGCKQRGQRPASGDSGWFASHKEHAAERKSCVRESTTHLPVGVRWANFTPRAREATSAVPLSAGRPRPADHVRRGGLRLRVQRR